MVYRVPLPFLVILPLSLAGCAQFSGFGQGAGDGQEPAAHVLSPGPETVRPQMRPGGARSVRDIGGAGVRPEALDQTSEAERAAALAPPAARTQFLGETLASLGSPAETGLWLRTGLVTRVTQGRIELRDGDGSLRVELRPSGAPIGSGGQLSLSAFTTLGIALTQLVGLRIYTE